MAVGELDIDRLRAGHTPARAELVRIVILMSVPTILSEISAQVMSYIDAGMVGSLGPVATASVGLVNTTDWLMAGMCFCASMGFNVQIAQLVGAGKHEQARGVLRQSMVVTFLFGLVMMAIGLSIAEPLPRWLGGEPETWKPAHDYFFWFSASLPLWALGRVFAGALQCSGDMRTPSQLTIASCFLDVIFNALLIFPGFDVTLGGVVLHVPGAGMGVPGAALGTVLAEMVAALGMAWALLVRSPVLALRLGGSWRLHAGCLTEAARIAAPMFLERIAMNFALVVLTVFVTPLGTNALAAHSLAITAEGICYMPGFGIAAAATTLVGQAIGAERRDLARRFSNASLALGMGLMGAMAVLMFAFAPAIMSLLTPDETVRALGTTVLRIEAFAEPLYAASIVGTGIFRGAGDTLVPSLIGLGTVWIVRLPLAWLLGPRLGLAGIWLGMATELVIRGAIFLVRTRRGKWLEVRSVAGEA